MNNMRIREGHVNLQEKHHRIAKVQIQQLAAQKTRTPVDIAQMTRHLAKLRSDSIRLLRQQMSGEEQIRAIARITRETHRVNVGIKDARNSVYGKV